MKNYAKFCKLKIQDKNYQLNLTEGGFDTAGWLGKGFSIIRLAPPVYAIYLVVKNLITFLSFGAISFNDISLLITALILVAGFCLPHTSLGNGFNAITKCFILKHKTKKYYSKMRELESYKSISKARKSEKLVLKQAKISKSFLRHLKHQTYRFERMSAGYKAKEEKRGYLPALKSFALENMEMHQEAIDKFIFHNAGVLLKLCPSEKEFIQERCEVWYKTIKNNQPYYDEYIYSASHTENLIKNDCINSFETSEYLERLRKMFNLKIEDEIPSYSLQETELKTNTNTETQTNIKSAKNNNELITEVFNNML